MKIEIKNISLCALFSMILLASCAACAEVVDKISIVVNDEIITESEIAREMQQIYEKYKRMYSEDEIVAKLEGAKQRLVQQIIEDKLILGEAKKQNIDVDEKDIDRKIEEVIANAGSRESLEKAMEKQHLTIKDLRQRYREQLMTRKIIDHMVGSRVTLSPVEIANYYNKHIAEFTELEEVSLRNILISAEKNPDPQKAAELSQMIISRLGEGCDFAGLAKIYSDGPGADQGGLMGSVKKGDLMPEIEKVVFNLKEGETSGVIQTSLGYHIFKVEGKRPWRLRSLSEAKRDIEEAVFKEKANQKVKVWVEGLKKNAYIAFK